MTYTEAIQKTEDAERKAAERSHAKYWLMRRIYRRVCKKIHCDYCPVCDTCHFGDAINRLPFRDSLRYIDYKDVVTVSRWSRDEAST